MDAVRDLKRFWISPLRCPVCRTPGFLEVTDMRWIYPLLRLEYGVLKVLTEAGEDEVQKAVEKIHRIDFKTVSIVDFEKSLMEKSK